MALERKDLTTEKQNPRSHQIDKRSINEILTTINEQDKTIAHKINEVLDRIVSATELAVDTIKNGHHIYYVGAGTSGRLGVLDSTEMPPTYSVPSDWFQGVIAGGSEALIRSIEGAEDSPMDAVRDLKKVGLTKGDLIIGIASSSATPYVIGALEYGKKIGTGTVYLICNPKPLSPVTVDVLIPVDVGPEIVTGSTRMKSGTATKMVLNMISTTTMIRVGKVYGNLMVDLQVVNNKLLDRGSRIIQKLTGVDYKSAEKALNESNGSVKTAVVMIIESCSLDDAEKLIKEADGSLRKIIGDID